MVLALSRRVTVICTTCPTSTPTVSEEVDNDKNKPQHKSFEPTDFVWWTSVRTVLVINYRLSLPYKTEVRPLPSPLPNSEVSSFLHHSCRRRLWSVSDLSRKSYAGCLISGRIIQPNSLLFYKCRSASTVLHECKAIWMHVLEQRPRSSEKLRLSRNKPRNVSAVDFSLQEGKSVRLGLINCDDWREQNSSRMWRLQFGVGLYTIWTGVAQSVGDSLRAGRSGDRIPGEARSTHPPIQWVPGFFRGVALTTHPIQRRG